MIDCPKTGLAENTFDAFLSLNSLKRLQYIELPLKWFQMSSKVYVCFMNEWGLPAGDKEKRKEESCNHRLFHFFVYE